MAKSKIIFSEEVNFDFIFPNLTFNGDSPARLKEVQVWEVVPSLDDLSKFIVAQD